jgi:hypothetical protein
MKEFIDKLIGRLEEEKQRLRNLKNDCIALSDHEVIAIEEGAYNFCKNIVNELAEEYKGGWIACTVVDHPEHCNDCEVTFKDVRGYGRDIAFYTDKWRRASDEVPILVVAWKEPSAPYTEGE